MDELVRRVPAGQVRIGDDERERAAATLGDHYAAGRLDREEFDTRLAAAYAARTRGELAGLFRDLPEPRIGPATARRTVPRDLLPAARIVLVVAIVVAIVVPVLALVAAAIAHGFPPFFLFGLLWLWAGARRRRRVLR